MFEYDLASIRLAGKIYGIAFADKSGGEAGTHTPGLHRPPARPQARTSRHALEPNPFEQSFSSKPSDGGASENTSPQSDQFRGDDVGASKPALTNDSSTTAFKDGGAEAASPSSTTAKTASEKGTTAADGGKRGAGGGDAVGGATAQSSSASGKGQTSAAGNRTSTDSSTPNTKRLPGVASISCLPPRVDPGSGRSTGGLHMGSSHTSRDMQATCCG